MSQQGMNGNSNATVQVNPQELAQFALVFLERCDLKPAERQRFAYVELLLQSIASGALQVVQATPADQTTPATQTTPVVEAGATTT